MAKPNDDKRPIIIIKRVKKVEGGHHGGAWKVAYADFVTAMMAFFLLLWLLNVTTDEQKAMISSYFAPADPRISTSTSGSGGVMGGTSMATEGAMTSDKNPVMAQQREPAAGEGKEDGDNGTNKQTTDEEKEIEAMDKADNKAFDQAGDAIKQAIQSQPELKELAQSLMVDNTPEGLRIQIVDQEGKPMFEVGSAKPLPAAEKLFALVASVVKDMPNKISVRGHTDSRPYGKDASYTNWELSSDRANASRRVMLADGLDTSRIENVQGKADQELLLANDPTNARNRRISIILMKQSITAPPGKAGAAAKPAVPATPKPPKPAAPETRKHEDGVIYFP
ncbi:MAG: flagellar motor protein MotB [Micavibrio sp.]|nr:flagellar motor protein MotB [Micavibrio sp.]